jgi:hypothetical protein
MEAILTKEWHQWIRLLKYCWQKMPLQRSTSPLKPKPRYPLSRKDLLPPINPQTIRPNLVPHDADLNDIARYILDLNSPLLNIQLSLSHFEEGYCRNRKLCGP